MAAKQLFSFDTLIHALSGVSGSCLAMTLVLPLDTVRTRLILDKSQESKTSIEKLKQLFNDEGL